MQRFQAIDLKNVYSSTHRPIGVVRPGEDFEIETEDCFGGLYRDPTGYVPDNVKWLEDNLDVLTGPVFVEGATPGSVVAVRILSIEITTPGSFVLSRLSSLSPWDWWLEEDSCMSLPIRDGMVVIHDGLTVPIEPLVGCLGTAPHLETLRAVKPGDFGGNLDCAQIGAGATVILPVRADGALVYFGDCKARMADGEVVQPPEVGTVITARIDVRPRPAAMHWPRIETDTEYMTIVSETDLGTAARQAFREMMLWLEEETSASRREVTLLMGMVADTGICQVSNTLLTARCTMPRSLVAGLGAGGRE